VSGAEQADIERVTFGVRYVEDQIDRAKLRTTLTYRFHPRFAVGLEYNPLDSDFSPLANWLAVEEKKVRPALMVGTSSDRIGTPYGQSYYATLSKNLKPWIKLPIAPYFGGAWGTYDDKLRAVAGANISFPKRVSSLVIYDGVHVHPTLSWSYKSHVFTFLLVEGKDMGVAYSLSFDLPSFKTEKPADH
jgi:hypothetical protein